MSGKECEICGGVCFDTLKRFPVWIIKCKQCGSVFSVKEVPLRYIAYACFVFILFLLLSLTFNIISLIVFEVERSSGLFDFIWGGLSIILSIFIFERIKWGTYLRLNTDFSDE